MMLEERKIMIGGRAVEAFSIELSGKNLIVLRGSRGFIMCGYLDLAVAEKFGDAAARITGVSTIDEALAARIGTCTSRARALGITEGQGVEDALALLS